MLRKWKRIITGILCAASVMMQIPVLAAGGTVQPIRIQASENGMVIPSREAAEEGAEVTLFLKPDIGYVTAEVFVSDASGHAVATKRTADGTCTFRMPKTEADVTTSFLLVDPVAAGESRMSFKDVRPDDWFREGVCYLCGRGLIQGVTETEFAPGQEMSLAMVLTLLHRIVGSPAPAVPTANTEEMWYATATEWAREKGVFLGSGELFLPQDRIPREFVAVLLYRCAAAYGCDMSAMADLDAFLDAGNVDRYAQDATRWAVAQGLIQGDGERLNPFGFVTRAEASVVLQRFCSRIMLLDGVG